MFFDVLQNCLAKCLIPQKLQRIVKIASRIIGGDQVSVAQLYNNLSLKKNNQILNDSILNIPQCSYCLVLSHNALDLRFSFNAAQYIKQWNVHWGPHECPTCGI